eukprot:3547157-Rhodomonas_salina.1
MCYGLSGTQIAYVLGAVRYSDSCAVRVCCYQAVGGIEGKGKEAMLARVLLQPPILLRAPYALSGTNIEAMLARVLLQLLMHLRAPYALSGTNIEAMLAR